MRISLKRHLTHWIAIAALAMGSLAPAISQAVSHAQYEKGISIELCTANGVKMTQVLELDQRYDSYKFEVHCPLCLVHGSYTLSLNQKLSFAKSVNNNIYPQLFYRSPTPLFSWVRLPSRAPPTFA